MLVTFRIKLLTGFSDEDVFSPAVAWSARLAPENTEQIICVPVPISIPAVEEAKLSRNVTVRVATCAAVFATIIDMATLEPIKADISSEWMRASISCIENRS
jgi:hypothetical protein